MKMKKTLFAFAIAIGFSMNSNAQISLKDVNSATATASKSASSSFDVNGITTQIVNSLQPKLKLTPEQVPQVTGIVSGLLNKKKTALPLMATDKAGYASAMSGIQSAFPSKMKTVLKAQQYTSLLSLIPKTSTSTNVLSKLLF
jgi:uncharacterized protein YajQ (UPF0234 family)